jgi:hypothetical protein
MKHTRKQVANALMTVSGGDMRKAITLMQNCHVLHGTQVSAEKITDAAAVCLCMSM